MNKRLKWAIPFAVLSVTCGTVGILSGCNGCNSHQHAYEWQYSETEHWKECPEDGEEQEGSRGTHVFEAGECECGATKQTPPVVQKKYGKVKLEIELCKVGTAASDYAGIRVDAGDDNVEVSAVSEDGVCELTNVEVGKNYTIRVTKAGYEGSSTVIQLDEEGEVAEVTARLEYTAFVNTSSKWDWTPNFYHTEEGTHIFSPKDNTVAIHSIDKFDDVAATLMVKRTNSTNKQGVWMFFDDGAMFPVYISPSNTVKFDNYDSYDTWGDNGNLAGGVGAEHVTNLVKDETVRDKDGNKNCTGATLDVDKCEAGTLALTLVRRQNNIYVFVDGKFADMRTVDSKYANQKVRFGYYSMDCIKNESVWTYSFTDDVSEYLTAVKPQVHITEGIADTVCTAVLDKNSYAYGDDLTLTVDLKDTDGYYIESVKIDGKKYQLNDAGELTVRVDSAYDISVSVFAKTAVALTADAKLKKAGEETALADGTEIIVNGEGLSEPLTVTVADGKITANLLPGEYIFASEGCHSFAAFVKADGTVEGGKLVFGYQVASAVFGSDKIDLSGMNDTNAIFKINSADADQFDYWGGKVPEIKLEIEDKIANSVEGTLSFNLKAERPNCSPNNAFGIVLAEGYKGVALSFWDAYKNTDGIAVHGLAGQKLGENGWGDDNKATLKWLENAVYSANGADFRAVRHDGTITIQAKNGDAWETVYTLEDVEDYVRTDLRFMGVGSNFVISKVEVDFEERVIVNLDSAELVVSSSQGFVANGTVVTLRYGSDSWTGTVADGKVTFDSTEHQLIAGRYNATVNFGGYQFKVGAVTINNGGEGELSLGFTGAGVEYDGSTVAANPSTGELTFKLGCEKEKPEYNNKYDIVTIENGGYFAQKIEFVDLGNKKLSLSVILRVEDENGTVNEIKQVIQNASAYFGEDGKFYWCIDDGGLGYNSVFNNPEAIDLSDYNDAIKAGNLWLVLGYDAETGALVSYVGTDLQSMVPVRTWGKLPAGLKITGFGVGNWFGVGGNSDTAKLTVKYGETMEAIGMKLEDQVKVNVSVNDGVMGKVETNAEDYYRGETCTLTITADLGYELKSIKIGEAEALLDGWTRKGRVYTYKLKVPAGGTDVKVTFAELPTVETAEITVTAPQGYTVNGAKLTFECLDKYWTATVADGKVVIGSADNRVTLGVHTVYVDFGGYQVRVGEVEIGENGAASAEVELKGVQDAVGVVGAVNPNTGEITFNLGKESPMGGWNNKYDIMDIDNGGYFAYKVKFNDIGDKLRSVSFGLRVETSDGNTKEIKQVLQNARRFFGEADKFYTHLDDDSLGGGNSIFGGGAVDLSKYNDDIKAGNLWLVLGYDAKTGALVSYVGTDLQNMLILKPWGSIPKGLKVVDLLVGNWFNDEFNSYGGTQDTATLTVKYGETMEDIGMKLMDKVSLNVNLTGLAVEEGTQFIFIGEDKSKTIYTVGDEEFKLNPGEYKVVSEGYATRFVTVESDSETIEISVALAVATALDYVTDDAGDNWGMGIFNFKDLVVIDENQIKINTSSVDGKTMNAFCRWNMNVPEATLIIKDDVKYNTEVTLEFNLKAANPNGNSNDGHNNAFGIVIAGYKGVGLNWGQLKEKGLNVKEVSGNKLGRDGWGNGGHDFEWLEELAYGADGVNIRAVRSNAKITFFAQNAEDEWIAIFETTCAADAKTDIKFLGMGSDYTVSQIKVTAPTDKKVTTEATVNNDELGSIKFENPVYFVGQQCTVTVTVKEGYELEKLVIGTTTVTEGWTQNGYVYTYKFTVEGNIAIEATVKQMSEVDVTFDITAKSVDGSAATLSDGTEVKFVLNTSGKVYTYVVGGEGNPDKLAIGEYTVTCYGYADTTVTVGGSGRVSVVLEAVIAYTDSDEITINNAEGTIAIKGNGAADRNNNRKISADLVLTEEQQTSKNLTLTFNVKSTDFNSGAVDNDEWAANRFGVQIGEGEIGFFLFLRGKTSSDVVKLNNGSLSLNPDKDGKGESKWHDGDEALSWINKAAQSSSGLNVKVVRADGVIRIYAQNGDVWVRLDEGGTAGDLTIGNDVKNEIKLLAGGNSYTFSNVSVTASVEQMITVSPKFEGDAHGFTTSGNLYYLAADAEKSRTITVTSGNWGYFPTSFKLGGEEIAAENIVRSSTGAGNCKYEITLSGVTESADLVITVEQGTIENGNKLHDADNKYTLTVDGGAGGSVSCDMDNDTLAYTYYWNDNCTVTVTPDAGYNFVKLIMTMEGSEPLEVLAADMRTASGYTKSFTLTGKFSVVAYFEQAEKVTATFAIGNEQFTANGATLTFTKGSDVKTGTVEDGEITVENMPVGTYAVTAQINGFTLSFGEVEVTGTEKVNIPLDGNSIFANSEVAALGCDLKDLSVTLNLSEKQYHNKLIVADLDAEKNYLLYKISLPADMKTALTENSGKKLNFTMPVVIDGGETTVMFVFQGGNVKYQLYGHGVDGFWGTERTLDAAYWTALTAGDGFYMMSLLDVSTRKLQVYMGTALDEMALTQDAATYTNGDKITTVSMGNAADVLSSGDCVTVSVKYGTSTEELGVTVTE